MVREERLSYRSEPACGVTTAGKRAAGLRDTLRETDVWCTHRPAQRATRTPCRAVRGTHDDALGEDIPTTSEAANNESNQRVYMCGNVLDTPTAPPAGGTDLGVR